MQAASVVIGAAATRIVGNGAVVPGGNKVLVRNSHASDLLLVGHSSAVAANNGFGVPAGQTLDLGLVGPGDVVWAIRGASADITAQILAT